MNEPDQPAAAAKVSLGLNRVIELEDLCKSLRRQIYQRDIAIRLNSESLAKAQQRIKELEAQLAPYLDKSCGIGGYIDAVKTAELNAIERAEAAEARCKELEEKLEISQLAVQFSTPWEKAILKDADEKVKKAEAQLATLRTAAVKARVPLGDVVYGSYGNITRALAKEALAALDAALQQKEEA